MKRAAIAKRWNDITNKARSERLKNNPTHRRYKYPVNEDFFKVWSDSMAYVLGFIAADGCIAFRGKNKNCLQLSIMSTDYSILRKIRNLIGELPIRTVFDPRKNRKYHSRNRRRMYSISTANKYLIEPLTQVGIVPRKSWNFDKVNVPDDYFWSFLRGYTDGDGCIGNKTAAQISWIGGSKKFMFWLLNKIKASIKSKSMHHKNPKNIFCRPFVNKHGKTHYNWTIHFGSAPAIEIMRNMYFNSTIHLDRKHKRAKAHLKRLQWKEGQQDSGRVRYAIALHSVYSEA